MRKFNHIASLIKRKRLSHPQGLSQSDLSHLLGYKNGQFISNVERALCNIPFKMMNKVCDILQISAAEIRQAMLDDYEETINAYLATHPGFEKESSENKIADASSMGNGFSSTSQTLESTYSTGFSSSSDREDQRPENSY